MKTQLFVFSALLASLLLGAGPVIAHHSMSMYDLDHQITLPGIVTDFEWSNPHAQVFFDVKKENGSVEKWTADCPSPRRLSKVGWTKDTLKAGDQITIVGNQAKDGSNVMRLDRIVLSGGQQLNGYAR
ncbi:MAG TPA: DUF6152 family protein [Candidatus Acidoferrales bacterium]|nr:DUF6152 family protein [Candidatus Acidoferrales bacterium]